VNSLVFFLAILLPYSIPTTGARDVVRAIDARYRGAKTLKATFLQSYADGKAGISAESGIVYFSKPGRMRWEYQSPEEKLFVVDGTNVWFYIPADRTASRAKIGESSDWRTPLAFLTGRRIWGGSAAASTRSRRSRAGIPWKAPPLLGTLCYVAFLA
jgi:outer membrane lipoprotein carrier protein